MTSTTESISSLDTLTVKPFVFDETEAKGTLDLIKRTDPAEFQLTASAALEEHDMALASLQHRIAEQGEWVEINAPPIGEPRGSVVPSRVTGYLAAFTILKLSAPEGLMRLDDPSVRGYEQRILDNPGLLQADIDADYDKHPAIKWFLSRGLTRDNARYGAMVMLGLHGKQANPDRPPISLGRGAIGSPMSPSRQQLRWAAGTGLPPRVI